MKNLLNVWSMIERLQIDGIAGTALNPQLTSKQKIELKAAQSPPINRIMKE